MASQESRTAYVKSLQGTLKHANQGLAEELRQIDDGFSKASGLPEAKLVLRTDLSTNEGRPALRVTCPTRSVVSAEISGLPNAHKVEFYLTKLRSDEVAETRRIGVNRYPDGDGKWNITFTTERFARKSSDPLLIHAEVLDDAGRLLALSASFAAP